MAIVLIHRPNFWLELVCDQYEKKVLKGRVKVIASHSSFPQLLTEGERINREKVFSCYEGNMSHTWFR